MNEQELQELNKKLAEWAGFNLTCYGHGLAWFINNEALYCEIKDSETPEECLPNFTYSLDACFKWLVPKAEEKSKIVLYDWLVLRNTIKEDALALCLAIEKLIDGEKNA